MDLTKIKFLLDENIPIKLKQVFFEFGMECITIQDLNWCGVKDKELSLRIKGSNYILVTRDKDFTFIWRQRKLKVVYITVEPAVLTNIEPRIREMFENWEYSVIQPFLLVIQNDSMRLWE